MSAQLSRCVAVYSRHFVVSRINAPAVVFSLDHFVTTQKTKSLLNRMKGQCVDRVGIAGRVDGLI